MSSPESTFLVGMDNKKQYRGKWVAILNAKVIAHGMDIRGTYAEATKVAEGKTPLFVKIPDKNKEQTLIL